MRCYSRQRILSEPGKWSLRFGFSAIFLCSGMLRHSYGGGGSILIFFEAFYFARLEVTDPLALLTQEGGNKGSNCLQVLLENLQVLLNM